MNYIKNGRTKSAGNIQAVFFNDGGKNCKKPCWRQKYVIRLSFFKSIFY